MGLAPPRGSLHGTPDAQDAGAGLICAFAIGPTDTRALVGADLDGPWPADAVVWLHFSATHALVRHWFATTDRLPAGVGHWLDRAESLPEILPVGEGACMALNELVFEAGDPAAMALVRAYVSPRLVVTARRHPLRHLDRLRTDVRAGWRASDGFVLFGRLLDYFEEAFDATCAGMHDELDDVEDMIQREETELPRERLARLRRGCAGMHRKLLPNRAAFARAAGTPTPGVPAGALVRRGADATAAAIGHIDMLRERCHLLQDEIRGIQSERANRSLALLAVVSAVFLPMNLIAGIFGMNLPLVGDGTGAVSWVLLLILVSGLSMLAVLRARRWRVL